MSAGVSIEDILRGIYDSLADRAALLLKRVEQNKQIGSPDAPAVRAAGQMMFIGGVAIQKGMVQALETRLEKRVDVPTDCEYVCALGAALLGLKRLPVRS